MWWTMAVRAKAAIDQTSQRNLAHRYTSHMGLRPGRVPFFAYDANYLIDNKVGIIR
jgi:hypothetical protein